MKYLIISLFLIIGCGPTKNSNAVLKKIALNELNVLSVITKKYYIQNNKYPNKISDLMYNNYSLNTWKRNLAKVPFDPWGNKYILQNNENEIIISSPGPENSGSIQIAIPKKAVVSN